MIDLYLWRTPNGYKPLIFVEESNLDYRLHAVDIGNNQQFAPAFLDISPNNKIPALVDGSIKIFESGAILLYLAQKTGQWMPKELSAHFNVMQWLMWQIGGLGPMMGQYGHFKNAAPESIPYAHARFEKETQRLLGVLENQLQKTPYVAGDYSIADIAIFPWIYAGSGNYLNLDLTAFPATEQWMTKISKRPAVIRAYEKGAQL